MPKYITSDGKSFNIPEEKVEGFERKYPDSRVEYVNEGRTFQIPIEKKQSFLKKYPNATFEPSSAPTSTVAENAPKEEEYVEGFGKAVKQSTEQLGAGFKYAGAEALDLVSQTAKDNADALAALEKMQAEGKDVAEETKVDAKSLIRPLVGHSMPIIDAAARVFGKKNPLAKMDEEAATDRTVRKVLKETGGNVDAAKTILAERAAEKATADKWREEAAAKMNEAKPTKGFGAWVGNFIPQMAGTAVGLGLSAVTKSPLPAQILGFGQMGALTASTAGAAMKEARDAGASTGEVWAAGLADAAVEFATEGITIGGYLAPLVRQAKSKTAKAVADAVLDTKSPARKELQSLLSRANEKLGGKLFTKENAAEYFDDIMREGVSELTAEVLQTITPMIYAEPENYPTLSDIINSGWEGLKGGWFMGSVLGGASKAAENRMSRARRKEQGYVDVAEVVTPDGETNVVEVLPDGDTPVFYWNGEKIPILDSNVKQRHQFPFEQFDRAQIEVEQAEAYEIGKTLETPAEKNDAKNRLEEAEKELRRLFGMNEDEDVENIFNGAEPIDFAKSQTDEDLRDAVVEYINASAGYNGMIDNVKENINKTVTESNALIDSRKNVTDGMIHPATMKLNDRKVYVTDGTIATLSDGTIDRENSSESIIVKDAQTGEIEFTDPSAILNADPAMDAEAEKATAAEAITTQMAEAASREIDNVLPFNVGDEYTFVGADGNTHTAVVVAQQDDNTVQVNLDGAAEPTIMNKADIQGLVDATNRNRAALMNQARKEYEAGQMMAQEAEQVVEQPTEVVEQATEEMQTSIEEAQPAPRVVPMQKDGVTPDFNAMDAEMFVEEYVSRFGEDSAVKIAKNNIASARKEIEQINKSIDAVSDPNKMQALFDKKQTAEAVLNRYADILGRLGGTDNETEAEEKSRLRNEAGNRIAQLFPDGLPNVESFILADIATGNRIRWSDKETNGTVTSRGLGSELGYTEAERRKRLPLIGKDAMTPEEYAESLRERLDAVGIRYDESSLRDAVLDVYSSVDSRKSAWDALESLAKRGQEQEMATDWEDMQAQRAYEQTKDEGVQELPELPDLETIAEETPISSEEAARMDAQAQAEEQADYDAMMEENPPVKSVDNQGNPINIDGNLVTEKVNSIDDITDEDFENPYRNVELPTLPQNVDDAIGANGKPVVIKKNIFERNIIRHSDLNPEQSRDILKSALYSPNLYGQNQKRRKPYNWVVVSTKDANGQNKLVLLEISDKKDNIEIVHWHYVDARGLEKLKRQAEREDGQLLILPSETTEEVGALSDPTLSMPSENKDTTSKPQKQEVEADISQENAENAAEEQKNTDETASLAENSAAAEPEVEDVAAVKPKSDKKIEDFGEKIGGARKDVARARLLDTVKLSAKDLESLKDPDKILSRKAIIKYMEEGQMTQNDGISLLALNMATRGKYRKALTMEKYREVALQWERGEDIDIGITEQDIDKYMANMPEAARVKPNARERAISDLERIIMTPYNDYRDTYIALNYPTEYRNLRGTYIYKASWNDKVVVVSGIDSRRGFVFNTYEQAVAKIKRDFPIIEPEKSKAKSTAKDKEDSEGHLNIAKDDMGWYRVKSRSIPGNIYLSGRFRTKKDAEAYLEQNKEMLLEREQKMTESLMGSNIGMVEREGIDYRNGQDVTPQDFLNTFGFRGVEFGNWVPQAERQLYLNKTYDAIMDFCNIIGISPKAFSLGGELALAFGARGKSRALAHYEPLKMVINLTRMKGAGSLAHEWFHAFDNYISKRKTGNISDMATARFAAERDEVSRAFYDLVSKMNSMDYTKRSNRAGDYWGAVEERAARLLESYIYNELESKNALSPLLVRKDVLFNEEELPEEDYVKSAWPYPSARENKEIKPYFDHLFSTLEEKVDEQDNVILFRLSDKAQTKLAGWYDDIAERYNVQGNIQVAPSREVFEQTLRDNGVSEDKLAEYDKAAYIPDKDMYLINGDSINDNIEAERAIFHEVWHKLTREIVSLQDLKWLAKNIPSSRLNALSDAMWSRGYDNAESTIDELISIVGENYVIADTMVDGKPISALEAYLNGHISLKEATELAKGVLTDAAKEYSDIWDKIFYEAQRNLLHYKNAYYERQRDSRGQVGILRETVAEGSRKETVGKSQAVFGGEAEMAVGAGREEATATRAEQRQRAIISEANNLAESLGVKMTIIEDLNDINDNQKRKRGSKAWYNVDADEVVFVAPNATSIFDAIQSVWHEVVAHKGLRDVVGREKFDVFLDQIFQTASEDIRSEIKELRRELYNNAVQEAKEKATSLMELAEDLAKLKEADFTRIATEEYMADLAEEGFDARENRDFWQKVRDLFMDMLREAKIILGYEINDNDLRYMLWRTYQMQKKQGAMAVAEDVVMQQKMGVGNFRTRPAGTRSMTEEEQIIADAKANGTYLKAPNGNDTNLTPEQWAQVRTKAFKNWFGDWENDPANASKVVDENGEPEEVWHGGDFAMGDYIPRGAMHFGSFEAAKTRLNDKLYGAEISVEENADGEFVWKYEDMDDEEYNQQSDRAFSTEDEAYRDAFSKINYVLNPYFLNIRNAERMGDAGTEWDDSIEATKEKGYDGVVYENQYEDKGSDSYIAFEPNQIKSAEPVTYDNNGGIISPSERFSKDNPDIRFRSAGDKIPERQQGIARQMYDHAVRKRIEGKNNVGRTENLLHHLQESYQDSMLSVKDLIKAVLAETGNELRDFEDVYKAENRLSSANKAQIEAWERDYMKPLQAEVFDLIKAGANYEAIVDYILAKSGIERNIVFAERDAQEIADNWEKKRLEGASRAFRYEEKRINGTYGGQMAALYKSLGTGAISQEQFDDEAKKLEVQRNKSIDKLVRKYERLKKNIQDDKPEMFDKAWKETRTKDYSGLTELTGEEENFTTAAYAIVDAFEKAYKTGGLWNKINAATKATLRKSYESGMMNKETFDKVSNMFKYYVPLRGWNNNAAADHYEYMANQGMKIMPALKTANGRTSRADDPIATIGSMGESSIIQGNRNLMKQKLLNFAQNNPTSLLTINEQWYVQQADGTWLEQNPVIPEDATADEVDAIIKQFEADMRALGNKAQKQKNGLKLGLHATNWEGQEHIVRVKRNGKEYQIIVNGNPIAAQAINGFTNPNAKEGWMKRAAAWIKNFMARAFTSMNPAFVITNLSRDLIWAGTSVAIKENAAYRKQYTKNIAKAFTEAQLPRLISKWKNGSLDMNNPIERYFNEFITNGGETGFTQLNSVDDYKRNIKRFVKEAQNGVGFGKKAWRGFWEGIEFLNRSAEDTTRFMVYMTSRQMGRSIAESVSNAKDVTVNFNKKGRGEYGATFMNFAYIFFNATIQSLANFGKLIKEHPKKTTAALTTFASVGMIAPMLSLAVQAMLSDDDDEPTYWDLPEWVRRNNIVLYAPFTESGYFTIPLPHELRPFYGMGELALSVLAGKEDVEDALKKAAEGFASLLPMDFTGNAGNMAVNFTPTIAQPFAQLVINKDYFGTPIYRKTAFNEKDPEWTKAYKSTNSILVDATEFINELSGGDAVKSGMIDINPAVVEHLLESYLGGVGKTLNRTAKTLGMLWNEDMREWRNVPVLSNFYTISDERTSGSQLNREYFDATDEAEEVEHLFNGYKKQAKMGSMEYAEKLSELMESPIFQRYQVVKGYKNTIADLNKALQEADKTDREELETDIMNLKVEMLDQLKELEQSNR